MYDNDVYDNDVYANDVYANDVYPFQAVEVQLVVRHRQDPSHQTAEWTDIHDILRCEHTHTYTLRYYIDLMLVF